jgi:hypothetical protein
MTTSLRLLLAVFSLLLISVTAFANGPLTLSNLETLFDSKVSSRRIVDLVNERKVSFELTKGVLRRLKGLGAPPSVIKAIEKNAVAALHVDSEPPGAEVFLDGKFKGMTPALFSKVLPGKHELQVGRVEGYQEYQAEIQLSAGETRKDKVFLKKREPIVSPVALPEVPREKQEITRIRDAAEPPIVKDEIPAVKDRPVSAPNSEPDAQVAVGQLVTVHVTTEPVSASIYLNDKYIGASPAQFLVPVGKHQLRLVPTLSGSYETYEKGIVVGSNAMNVFFLRLDSKRD